MNDRFTPTQYGFDWGPMRLTRCISDAKYGHYIEINTDKGRFVVRVTPSGNVMANKQPHNQPNVVYAKTRIT